MSGLTSHGRDTTIGTRMKRVYVALFCAALMVAFRPAPSLGDELDDLLASEPVGAPSEVVSGDVGADEVVDFDLTNSDTPGYTDPSRWQPAIGVPTPRRAKSKSPSTSSTQKSVPPGDLNVVPEPSTIALAALALVYFLVFGRRRQVT